MQYSPPSHSLKLNKKGLEFDMLQRGTEFF